MNRQSRFAPPFRLGEWTVRPALNRVSGPGGDVRLEPRVMAVLVRLAAEPGRVVGRLDLLDEVWGDAVVGEEILTRAVSELRRIFGDRAREPRYIETIINNGYRLIAAVEPLAEAEDDAAPEPAAAVEPAPRPVAAAAPVPGSLETPPAAAPEPVSPPGGSWLRRLLPTVFLLAVAVVVVVLVNRRPPASPTGTALSLPPEGARAVPLTAFPGHERQPAVTADGLRVVFAWAGPEGDNEGIWVKQRNSETPLRLGGGPGMAAWPTWSPDGQTVAWVQRRGGLSEIRAVPSLGGPARTLLEVPGAVVGLDWSPDGARLLFAARDTATGLHRLRRLDPGSLAVQDLDPGERMTSGEVQPRCSPDGARLAWIRLGADGTSSLWIGDGDGRDRRELLAGYAGLGGLAWSADGRSLVVGIEHAGAYGLWAVPVAEGEAPRRLTETTEFAWNPTVAAGTGELVYEQVRVDQDLWRIRILGRDPWRLATSRFLASTRWEYEAQYSPDGRQVAVVSARSGTPELWLCDADGGDLRRLTDVGEAAAAKPRWLPDGRRIAFSLRERGHAGVAVVPAAGGPVRRLTPPGQDEQFLGLWGANPAGLLIQRGRGRQAEQKVRNADTGELEAGRPAWPCAAVDGSYWVRPGGGLATGDGTGPGLHEVSVVPELGPADADNWRVVGREVFWVMRAGGEVFLMIRDLESGADAIVTDLPGFAGTGLAVAPDGGAVIYPRLGPAEGDLMRLVNP